MSGNIRTLWIASTALVGSVIVVRSLAASPEPVLDDPPVSIAATRPIEIEDTSLAEVIHRFATLARAPRLAETP
ncbi:MAG TPA: hypothetical protein VH560_15030 [Polyangia bacterium]|jgi:hypothetical protein|nr:hypothetical protein [Polyangia bacterium]